MKSIFFILLQYRDWQGSANHHFSLLGAFLARNIKKTPPKVIFGGIFCNFGDFLPFFCVKVFIFLRALLNLDLMDIFRNLKGFHSLIANYCIGFLKSLTAIKSVRHLFLEPFPHLQYKPFNYSIICVIVKN